MLKSLISQKLSVVLLASLSTILPFKAISAATFQETEVNQQQFIAIAQPFGENKYNLIVIEQIPDKDACWNEQIGTQNPTNIDLLLLDFDFSGHCRRSTDANGYSIRYDGQDLGLDFLLTLVERDGQLVLLGSNRRNPQQGPIIVGSSEGINGQPMKIKLQPGWRFSKRTYEGKVLGHVYFSYDSASNAPDTSVNEEINSTPTPLNNNNEVIEEVEENVPQGNIREIVAPDIEPQKQMKKSDKTKPISTRTKIQYLHQKMKLK